MAAAVTLKAEGAPVGAGPCVVHVTAARGAPEMPAHRQALPEVPHVKHCPVCLQCTAVRFDLNICSAHAK